MKKITLTFLLVMFVMSGIVFAAEILTSADSIIYKDDKTVSEALDDLLGKANATAEDILIGKTAYVNGKLLTGTAKSYQDSYDEGYEEGYVVGQEEGTKSANFQLISNDYQYLNSVNVGTYIDTTAQYDGFIYMLIYGVHSCSNIDYGIYINDVESTIKNGYVHAGVFKEGDNIKVKITGSFCQATPSIISYFKFV